MADAVLPFRASDLPLNVGDYTLTAHERTTKNSVFYRAICRSRPLVIFLFKWPIPCFAMECDAEARICALLCECPNVVRGFDPHFVAGACGFFMLWHRAGDLHEWLCSAGAYLSIGAIRRIGVRVLRALAFMHRLGVAHRDVKLENIFIERFDDAGAPVVLLADFGLARAAPAGGLFTDFVGTAHNAAPEVHANRPYTAAADLFSFGVVLYEIVTGAYPFGDAAQPGRWRADLARGRFGERALAEAADALMPGIGRAAVALMRALLAPDPAARLTAEQALEHEFFVEEAAEVCAIVSAAAAAAVPAREITEPML
jgi:serine/threonine protein kinase